MKKAVESTFIFLAKNIAYIVLSIGYPLGYLYYNYDLYETMTAVTKLQLAGVVSLIIIIFFAKGMLSDYVYSMKLEGWQGYVKKFMWGVDRCLPMIAILVIVNTLTYYNDLVSHILTYTILTNLFVFYIAPNAIINKKNKVG